MTAIVGVMNKRAIALAADSAVTMGNTHKVVNTGNKLFALSKYEPVAIAIYNNASLLATPWELIIKMYRQHLSETNFPKVRDYSADFFGYLKGMKYFNNDDDKQESLVSYIYRMYSYIQNRAGIKSNIPVTQVEIDKFSQILSDFNDELSKVKEICSDFLDYTYREFLEDIKESFDECVNFIRTTQNLLTNDNIDLFRHVIFNHIIKKTTPFYYTGVVFAGYGKEEFFPEIDEFFVSVCLGNRLKYHLKESESGKFATIYPFAQTDVINTIIKGIAPGCLQMVIDSIRKSLVKYHAALINVINAMPDGAKITSALNKAINLDDIVRVFNQNTVDLVRKEYTDPLLNTIESLDKTDLANMAESLVSLTCLVRRMQPGEETVGGPVDVMLISKGDGLIWMNRKHYFNPDLNRHFFSNYFKN